jgi:hypothetical protein
MFTVEGDVFLENRDNSKNHTSSNGESIDSVSSSSSHASATSTSTINFNHLAINPQLAANVLATLSPPTDVDAAIASNPENPSYSALAYYISLFKADNLRNQGICPYCYTDESCAPSKRTKNHKLDLSNHLWSCSPKHRIHETLCPMCGLWLPVSAEDARTTDFGSSQVSDHFERCLECLCKKLELQSAVVSGGQEESVTNVSMKETKQKGRQTKVAREPEIE